MNQYPWCLKSRRTFIVFLTILFLAISVVLLITGEMEGLPIGVVEVAFMVAIGIGSGLLCGFAMWELVINPLMRKYDQEPVRETQPDA